MTPMLMPLLVAAVTAAAPAAPVPTRSANQSVAERERNTSLAQWKELNKRYGEVPVGSKAAEFLRERLEQVEARMKAQGLTPPPR